MIDVWKMMSLMFPFVEIILHSIIHVLKQHVKDQDSRDGIRPTLSPHLAHGQAILDSQEPKRTNSLVARSGQHLKNRPKISPRAAKSIENRPNWSPHWPATSSGSLRSTRARKVPVRAQRGPKKSQPGPAQRDTVILMDSQIEIPKYWHEIASNVVKTMAIYGLPSTYIFFLMGFFFFPMIYHMM